MRGAKPKPTHLKEVNGNPGKRKLNKNEPKAKGEARCPEWLHPDAKKEWKRLSAELKRLGLLSLMDTAAFAGYCQSYAMYRHCVEYVNEHGPTYKVYDQNGDLKMVRAYPEVAQSDRHLANIRAFAAEFGFTPSSRGRIEVDTLKNTESPMAEYMRKKKNGT